MTSSPVNVSVLIANFNHAHFIGHTLTSLVEQSAPAEEVIVVDDASTDNSVEIIESYRSKLPGLRLVRNPINLGAIPTFNRALDEARCNYISFCSADDWFEPQCLQRLISVTKQFNQPRLCLSRFVQYSEADKTTLHHGYDSEIGHWYLAESDGPQFYSPEKVRGILHRGYTWLNLNGSLIHRDTLRAIGGYDPDLRWHSDWLAAFTIAFRYGFAIIPEPLSAFRLTAGAYSTNMRDSKQQIAVCKAIYAKLNEPEFADIRDAVYQCPAALAPFLRHFMIGLAPLPRTWPFLVSPALWLLQQVGLGRRPGIVRDFAASLGIRTTPR